MRSTLGIALGIMLSLQAFLFMGQFSVNELNNDYGVNSVNQSFFNYENSTLSSFDKGNYQLDEDVENKLPDSESGTISEGGNLFTDVFSSTKNWILEKTGAKYVIDVLRAPSVALGALNLPKEFVFALSAVWYGIMLFLIVTYIKGGAT